MRMWILVLPLATLLTVACADTAETKATSEQDGNVLIERMTRDRKPATATPSTLRLEGPVLPVKRVPLSTTHVEVGSNPSEVHDSPARFSIGPESAAVAGVDSFELLPASEPSEPNLAGDRSEVSQAKPSVTSKESKKQLRPATVVRPNGSGRVASSAQSATKSADRSVKPQASFTDVPEIQFDPVHGEHTLKLPNTDDDGFVGVSRSRRDIASQQPPKSGQHQNQTTNQHSRQQQRVLPKFFRRGR